MDITQPPKNPAKNNFAVSDTETARTVMTERAILVHIDFSVESIREDLAEFKELAISAGADPVMVITGTRKAPDAKYFVGSGKAEEIKQAVQVSNAKLVLFNHALTPGQERNLEKLCKARVLDRTGLILDIFAQRARSFEGKLQVELALLKHLSTRLVRGWTHLERQRGGIGLRGPGETQLETDRRLIRQRIQFISKRLMKVRKQRSQSRRARKRATIPTIALVGYTNAGKSTLFNRLTEETVYVANRLFATLDPTLRRITIPEVGPVILADTVGFIRHLPHDLVEAFHATLEEVSEADLLLHVVDCHDERRKDNIAAVNHVLATIEAEDVPILLVYNKADLRRDLPSLVHYDENQTIDRVYISAQNGLGMKELQDAIVEYLKQDVLILSLSVPPSEAKLRAELYQRKVVLSETIDETGYFLLQIKLPRVDWEKFCAADVKVASYVIE